MRKALQRIRDDESGHVAVGVPSLVAAIGAVALGIGAASDSDAASIAGGIVLGLGIMAVSIARHRSIDYDVYRRLEELKK
jgi:hypothetical protein